MSDKSSIALIGYSGHAYVIAEALKLRGSEIVGYCEKNEAKINPYNLTYFGDERNGFALSKIKELKALYFVSIGNNEIRKNVIQFFKSQGYESTILVHPSGIVSTMATIGEGSFVGSGAIINPFAEIGMGVIVNTGAIVEHECKIGDYSHIAPGAVLSGNVAIGEGAFIGANTVIKQNIKIGANATVGAGAVVVKDIPDNQVWMGNPAKHINQNNS